MQIKILVLVLLAVGIGCNRKPSSQKEQVSYTIGAQFGKSLKSQNLELDTKALANGIADGYKGEKTQMSEEEMQAAMMRMSEDRQKEVKADSDKNKKLGEEYLAKNKGAEGVKTTASGLQYKIITQGTGAAPKIDDIVVVNYKGTLIDGTEFDSSYKRNMPAEFPLKGVIPGWAEGLQLLKKGGKAMFFIPPELGYQDRPRQQIPGNSVLVFEVELLEVKSGKTKK